MRMSKKITTLSLFIAITICMLFGASGCSGCGKQNQSTLDEEATVTIEESAVIYEYESYSINKSISGKESAVTWKSSDEKVVTVDENGRIYGVSSGTAVVTAKMGNSSSDCKVTVNETTFSHEIVFYNGDKKIDGKVAIMRNKPIDIAVEVLYKGEVVDISAASFDWESSSGNLSVIKDGKGVKAKISGSEPGSYTVTVSSTVRGKIIADELQVKVAGDIPVFDFDGDAVKTIGQDYVLNLSFDEELKAEKNIGNMRFTLNGEDKGEMQNVVWSSDKDFVTVEGNKVSATKSGNATITAVITYENKEYSVSVKVNVLKYNRDVTDLVECVIETAKDTAFTLPEVICANVKGGDVTCLTIGGKVVYDGTTESTDETVAYIANSLPVVSKDMGRNIPATIETEKAIYTFTADVYTMLLKTKEDIDKWQTVAIEQGIKANANLYNDGVRITEILAGYYAMANDIDYNGDYYPKSSLGAYNTTGQGRYSWDSVDKFGFAGVFDGNGYRIKGLEITQWAGSFVVNLATDLVNGTTGKICNVAFTDLVLGAQNAGLIQGGKGTIENVYISVKSMQTHKSWDGASVSAVIAGSTIANSNTVKNLVIDLTNATLPTDVTKTHVYGCAAYSNISGAYVVGDTKGMTVYASGREPAVDGLKKVAGYNELLNDEDIDRNFKEWLKTFCN